MQSILHTYLIIQNLVLQKTLENPLFAHLSMVVKDLWITVLEQIVKHIYIYIYIYVENTAVQYSIAW